MRAGKTKWEDGTEFYYQCCLGHGFSQVRRNKYALALARAKRRLPTSRGQAAAEQTGDGSTLNELRSRLPRCRKGEA